MAATRRARNDRFKRLTEFGTLLIAAANLAITFGFLWPQSSQIRAQVRTLNAQTDVLDAQIEEANVAAAERLPSLYVDYFTVSSHETTFIDLGVQPRVLRQWSSDVLSPDFSAGGMRPYVPGSPGPSEDVLESESAVAEYVGSPLCDCQALSSLLMQDHVDHGEPKYFYLHVVQVGGRSTEVILTLQRFESTDVSFWSYDELADVRSNQTVSLSLGPMEPGEERLVPLATLIDVYEGDEAGQKTNLGSAFLPTEVSSETTDGRRQTDEVRSAYKDSTIIGDDVSSNG